MKRLMTLTPWGLLLLIGMLIACTSPVTPETSASGSAYAEGTAMLPASGTTGALAEQAAVGGDVRLLSRDGAETASKAIVDGLGHFKFELPDQEGLFIIDVALGARHLKSLVQLQRGHSLSTVVNVASTLVAAPLLSSSLKLNGLPQSRFDTISSQAHALMTMADVPDLATDAMTRAGAEVFLNSHLIIKQQVDELLANLAQLEGVQMSAISPSTAPGVRPTVTPHPEPLYTQEPLPFPSQVPAGLSPLTLLGERSLDSAPGWLANEGNNMLWVSCPASNSIIRFERSSSTWRATRPMSPRIASPFMPAQLAVNAPKSGTGTVWVANQHPAGTKVAYCDTLGNFLGTVEVGLKPSALGLDTAANEPHVWMGVNGDSSGKVVVTDLRGNLLGTTQTAPYPFRFLGGRYDYYDDALGDSMWIATPRTIYRAPLSTIRPTDMTIGTAANTRFTFDGKVGDGTVNANLNHDVASMALTPLGDVWVVLQDAGAAEGVLLLLYDTASDLLQPTQIQPFKISAPITGLVVDPTDVHVLWVSTENELLRFGNGSVERPSSGHFMTPPSTPSIKGLFVGADSTFWAALDHPAKLVKLWP